MSLRTVIEQHRLIVCVGSGGVGKTTIAAAIALAGAMHGRRAMVLTIDPARQLARALGLPRLTAGGEEVPHAALRDAGLTLPGTLDAGMLDQKTAWDAFIARHAPSPYLRDAILANAFYQQLSTSFSGSTEYMAVEELCRLDETGRYDLIVLDTPPAAHALDFLEAPARVEELFDHAAVEGLARAYVAAGRGAWRTTGIAARWLLRRLEHATSAATLRNISGFFVAFDALLGDVTRRTETARTLLRDAATAFVLVAGPQRLVRAESEAIARRMARLRAPLRGLVLNRVPPLLGAEDVDPAPALAALAAAGVSPDVREWLQRAWTTARAEATRAAAQCRAFEAALPGEVARAVVPEADHDTHRLSDLREIASAIW